MEGLSQVDQEALVAALRQVRHYKSLEECQQDRKDLDRTPFAMKEGLVEDITLGTYNKLTGAFMPRPINDSHIVGAILHKLDESEGYGFLDGTSLQGEEVALPYIDYNDLEEYAEEMSQAEYIESFTDLYNVFTLDGRIYIDCDY